MVWITWLLVLIDPGSFLGIAPYVIPFGTLAAFPFALVALRDPANEGRWVTRMGGLAQGMSLASTLLGVMAVLVGLLNSAGQM